MSAPHNDAKMRGFTPCTYQMAVELNYNEEVKFMNITKIVGKGYLCYFDVVWEGLSRFFEKKQMTPWENYLFVPEGPELNDDGIPDEPFSEDLLKANMLDEDESSKNTETQEIDDEKKF